MVGGMMAQQAGPVLSEPVAWAIGLAVAFGPLLWVAASLAVQAWQERRGGWSPWRRALIVLGRGRQHYQRGRWQ